MALDASALSLLRAVFALGALTAAMAGWMSVARAIAMRRAGLTLQDAAHTRDMAPRLGASARRVADNYAHLLETPTLFYAVALAIVAAGLADPLHARCAWAFVILRALHSATQATFNRVALRAVLYGLSWLALAEMIVRPLLTL